MRWDDLARREFGREIVQIRRERNACPFAAPDEFHTRTSASVNPRSFRNR
jgi:hypothetical protein